MASARSLLYLSEKPTEHLHRRLRHGIEATILSHPIASALTKFTAPLRRRHQHRQLIREILSVTGDKALSTPALFEDLRVGTMGWLHHRQSAGHGFENRHSLGFLIG
jgi:hypothetical protein